jgi:hypothetical protein
VGNEQQQSIWFPGLLNTYYSTVCVAKVEQLRIKMCKAELILGLSPLRRAFDKQVISGQVTAIPGKMVQHKQNSPQQVTENTKKDSTDKRAEETKGDH